MFDLPENLSALDDAALEALRQEAITYGNGLVEAGSNDMEALGQAEAAFQAIAAEQANRVQAAEARARLSASFTPPPAVEPVAPVEPPVEPEVVPAAPEPQAVTAAAGRPSAVALIHQSTLDEPPPTRSQGGTMVVAPDVPGMSAGTPLTSFRAAAEAITNRLRAYPKPPASSRGRLGPLAPGREIAPNMFSLDMTGRAYVRHGGVVLRREFDPKLTLGSTPSDADVERVKAFASGERRLSGGSLLTKISEQVKAGKALTAAAGWCSPSETIYSLCDLSSLDGLLDLPEIQAARGGFNVPADGGPDFSVVWNGIGDAGDVILTEYDIQNGAIKSCFDIPCPDFVDVRLDAAYLCLTGSLLQRRTYPEVVELFSRQSMKALAHKINESVIARIVAGSGALVPIAADASGDDAAAALLGAVALGIRDIKYRERMETDVTLEVVMPYWFLDQMRAAMSRRYGIGRLDVADREIFDWFAIRNAVPRWVYDWQDAYSGLVGGPGGATPLTAFPTSGEFLVYPAGTWTKISQDVVNLDTIYDNAMLTTNEYTAVFAEDGFNVIKTCPQSRRYGVQLDPSGVVGCCA